MPPWFLNLIGIEGVLAEQAERSVLAFQYPMALWIGLPILLPVTWFVFFRQKANLLSTSLLLRSLLTGTRVGVLLLLVLILSGPYVKLDLLNEKKPIVALLVDHSQSMDLELGDLSDIEIRKLAEAAGQQVASGPLDPELRKAFRRQSRSRLAQLVLNQAKSSLFDPISKQFDLQVMTFSKDIQPIAMEPNQFALPEPTPPGGTGTYIGSAIGHVINEAAGQPIAGIILVSDGENTGGRSPLEVAYQCQRNNTPIFTLPVGSANRFKDVAIIDVSSSGQVAVGDTAKVGVVIESQGFDGKPVKIILKDGTLVLDTKEITLRGSEQQQVELTFTAKEPGSKYLTVEVPPFPEEDLKTNNTDVAFLRIGEEKLKVLYLEGPPRWDFRFLKNAMRRDQGLAGRLGKQPEILLENEWRLQPDVVRAKSLPQNIEELAAYHTIILGDVSPKMLNENLLKLLDQAVREKGVGLLIEVGPQSMPHAFDKTLWDLLPVQLDHKAAGVYAPPAKPFKLELAADGTLHDAMRLYDDTGRNQVAWSQMLPYQWCVAAVRPAPAATVLAWNPNIQNNYGKLPLISWHFVGQGRVMLVGTDSTWLWRQNVADRFFYKFWGQSIRFVARRDDGGKKKTWLEVSPVRAQPDDDIAVELMAYTDAGAPILEPSMKVDLTGPGVKQTLTLHADPNSKGRYTGKVQVPTPGEYRFLHKPDLGDAVEAKLRVLIAPEEQRYPNVNRQALKSLAETTHGEMLELSDPDLSKKILAKLKGEIKQSKRSLEATLWDNWLVLTLLVVIYCLDIGLRRLSGLA